MRLLLFSDLHCDAQASEALVRMAKGVDLVLGAGDFANCHHGIEICLAVLKKISAPAVLVAGKAETADELRVAAKVWPSAIALHGEGQIVAGQNVFGLGGAVPVTPFGDWSFDFSEEEGEKLLQAMPKSGILVTHSPPKGVLDADSRGRSLGSTAIRNAVLAKAPKLVVCGHIHASGGKQAKLGDSLVLNAGPKGLLIDLP
jgi:uncharacterized protein